MSDYPTFTSILRVDGLSTDPRGMGCHSARGPARFTGLAFSLDLGSGPVRLFLNPNNYY